MSNLPKFLLQEDCINCAVPHNEEGKKKRKRKGSKGGGLNITMFRERELVRSSPAKLPPVYKLSVHLTVFRTHEQPKCIIHDSLDNIPKVLLFPLHPCWRKVAWLIVP